MPVAENRGSTVRNLQAFQVRSISMRLDHWLSGGLVDWENVLYVIVVKHQTFIPPGFTISLHEMRLPVPGWNHPGRHLDHLPRGQRQLLPPPEPAHAQPGRGEDCREASKRAGEILSAHRVPRPPSPTHSHQGAHSNQVEFWKFENSRNLTRKFQPLAEKQEELGVLCPRCAVAHFHPQVGQHLQRCLQRSW